MITLHYWQYLLETWSYQFDFMHVVVGTEYINMAVITHSQREAYMVLVRNGGSGSGGSGGRQLSQNPNAI